MSEEAGNGSGNNGNQNGADAGSEQNANGKRVYSEETYTLDDVLEAESHWEETANAVLGASDNKNCSYKEGYVKRQALYACLTCNPPSNPNYKPAGICLACSLNCHDGHDLVELYTKRNFRCDCGNQKFYSTTCKLEPMKDEYNENNSYNHNFEGLYCTCNRPYPDPEEEEHADGDDEEEDEMIQCVVCEDWLHGKHIKNNFDFKNDEFSEFICECCTKKCDFLNNYYHLLNKLPVKDISATDNANDVVGETDEGLGSSPPRNRAESAETPVVSAQSTLSKETEDATSQDSGTVVSAGTTSDIATDEESQNLEVCFLDSTLKEKRDLIGGTWWLSGWREKLCKCPKCLEKYKALKVEFLLDYEDTLAAYEALGKARGSALETADQILQGALNKLDRVAQIEVIHGFNEMKTELEKCLRLIADSGRAVTSEDIQTFFAGLAAKRRKVGSGVHIPSTCR